jgi:hypothetical protein
MPVDDGDDQSASLVAISMASPKDGDDIILVIPSGRDAKRRQKTGGNGFAAICTPETMTIY